MQDSKSESSRDSDSEELVRMPKSLDKEDLLALLTMHYIERVEQGENPTLEEYTTRYPDLTGDLKVNIENYWFNARELLEAFKREDASTEYQAQLVDRLNDPKEQERARKAVAKILAGAASEVQTQPVVENLTSLYQRAREKKLSPPQLARKLGIPSDIMMALEQRLVNLTGIPRCLITQLSEVLEVSNRQITTYLSGGVQTS